MFTVGLPKASLDRDRCSEGARRYSACRRFWGSLRPGVTRPFRCIRHRRPDILLLRLKTSFGLDGVVCSWFRSYLTGRVQRVRRGSSVSASVVLLYGVPQQGSVLGLLLFILYTADLICLIESFCFRPHLYADDSQIQGSLSP